MASHKKKQKRASRWGKKKKIRRWAPCRSMMLTKAATSVSIKTEKFDENKNIEKQGSSFLQPVKIHSDALLEVWQKFDSSLGVPESCVNFHYVSPMLFESAENVAMFNLFVKIVKSTTKKQLNFFLFGDINYEISPGLKGLCIRAEGYNPKLPTLLKDITGYVTRCWDFLTKDLFDLSKKENLTMYHRKIMDPKRLVEDVRQSLTILYYWSNTEMYAALSTIDFEKFQDFCKHFTDHMYVQCFVQGNMNRADVISLALACVELLKIRPLLPNTMPQHSINEIPRGVHCCRLRSFDSENLQSFVTNYYQFEDPSFKLFAMLDYLRMVMEQYLLSDADCHLLRGIFGTFGYAIMGTVVEGETVEDVDSRIETFRRFFNETYRNIKSEQLLMMKQILITVRTDNLNAIDRVEDERENWNEIMTEKYCFNREARELEVLKKMTVEELRMWMMKFTAGENDYHLRKISIQIVGYDDSTTRAPDKDNDKSNEFSLKYLTRLSKDTKRTTRFTSDYYITDIEEFRQTLNILPLESSSL